MGGRSCNRIECRMGKFGNTNTVLTRHDYKRACYRAMLSEFTIEEVAEFFSKLPLNIEGKTIKGPELYALLWNEKGKIPLCWDSLTDNLIEPFLIGKGRDVNRVLNKILWLNNRSTYIPGKILLTWFYPKLESLFSSIDTRDMIFAFITLFTENYLPKHIHRRIKRWEEGEWIKSIQVFISDTEFNEFLDWDYEFIVKPQIMSGPTMFGMPPFEGFGMISDTRSPSHILWEKGIAAVMDGDVLNIGGEIFGRRGFFTDFCTELEIDLSKFNPPDLEIAIMEKDYRCPIRKRVVLHKGCAYGAPVFLNWVSHRKLDRQQKDFLRLIVGDIEREEDVQKDELELRHQAMLSFAAGKSSFAYHSRDECITVNGRHFIKGVPAKILKYLLELYLRQGKEEFEYRELKRIFEISQGQKNSNFEVRFYRLAEKLESETTCLRIEKTGRGRFHLHVNGTIHLEEIDS